MSKGKVLITFDDGIANQYFAFKRLSEAGLSGVFGVVANKINEAGFCTLNQLYEMKQAGHMVVNHSYSHGRYKGDKQRNYLKPLTESEIITDFREGKKALGSMGFDDEYYIVPFGTMTLNDNSFKVIGDECKWIRLTIGCNINDEWFVEGNKRIYPGDYKDNCIGLTVAVDCRFPNEVRQKIDETCKVGGICVISYNDICHVVGENQKITWEQFDKDIEYITEKIDLGELECILPTDIIEEKK